MDEKTYRGMIGSLLYLTASRLDIMFSVCLCARFQKEPWEVHLFAVNCIFRYLIGTPNHVYVLREKRNTGFLVNVMRILLEIK